MLKMTEFDQIRVLLDLGKSNSEIARALDISRSTVRKYKRENAPPKYKPRSNPSRIDPTIGFEPQLREWIKEKPDIRASALYDILKEQSYSGTLRTLQRKVYYLRREQHPPEQYFEQEYELGEQCQIDFKESVELPFKSGKVVCDLVVIVLPASGLTFIKAYPNKTFEAFADGLHSFFEYIGGIPKALRFDNLKAVVKKVLKGDKRLYTRPFERLQKYYGFKCLPCRPATGSDKGAVERGIRTVAGRISDKIHLTKREFLDFNDLNSWLIDFAELSLRTQKGETLFNEEQKKLNPCPPRDSSIIDFVTTSHVTKHGTILIKKSRYSVPPQFIGQELKVVASAYDVKVYDKRAPSGLITCHKRMDKGTNSILLEHTIDGLVRKPQAMIRWAHRDILFPHPVFSKYHKQLEKIIPERANAEFLKSLSLIHQVSISDLQAAIELVLESGSTAPSEDLKKLALGHGHYPKSVFYQPPIDFNLSKYNELIPA